MNAKDVVFELDLPEDSWIGSLSNAFDDEFQFVDGHAVDAGERVMYITSKGWSKEHVDFIRSHEQVIDVEEIGDLARVPFKAEYLSRIDHARLLIRYPAMVYRGRVRLNAILTAHQLRLLEEQFESLNIISVGKAEERAEPLTPRQQEVLFLALSQGYFSYPRGITLTDLARALHVSKATLSETLRGLEMRGINALLRQRGS